MENSRAVKIGNLITEMHNVLNAYYESDKDRRKAIHDIVTKIYRAGYTDGYYSVEL